ncbi:DNA-binding protein [Candidatus Peregrinibacteria bacterium]|nr:DNA-binding protein [Candidatus Peregrinibacteria bacterium]
MRECCIDKRWFLRIERGEAIMASIADFLCRHAIRAGSISGIGAASEMTLRYYSMEDKRYHDKTWKGEFEIASLLGNVAVVDGKPAPHVHIVLGDTNFQAIAGHLHEAVVGVTCEIIIDPASKEIIRFADEETGLNLWDI